MYLDGVIMTFVAESRSRGPLTSRPPTGNLDGRGGARRFVQ